MDPLWPESIILGIAAMACVRADGRRGAGHAWLGRGWGRHICGVTDFLLYVPANAVPWSRPAVRPARSAVGHLRRGGHRARFHWLRPAHPGRSEEHTSELQSLRHLVCRLLLEKKKKNNIHVTFITKKKKTKRKQKN